MREASPADCAAPGRNERGGRPAGPPPDHHRALWPRPPYRTPGTGTLERMPARPPQLFATPAARAGLVMLAALVAYLFGMDPAVAAVVFCGALAYGLIK